VKLPQLSVIVATWNRPDHLDEALRSISLQGEAVPFEVIVVNDGGGDVGPIVARWARHMAVQSVNLEVNAGLARARNEGIRRAQGDILCFLDDDDLMLPGHLRTGVAQLNEDVDAVCTQVAVCDEFISAGAVPPATRVKAQYGAAFDDRLLMICNFIPVNALFIRRRPEVPIRFDETLSALEDWDLWLRLRQQLGYRFASVPLTTAVYHRVPGFGSLTSPSRESAEAAVSFRDTFRKIASRYPSSDETVTAGRAIHDHFYAALARASSNGQVVSPFAYERFVECMEAFTRGATGAAEARARIESLVTAQ
jgi:glycosyltransferase involved in cell wall biosynthesis